MVSAKRDSSSGERDEEEEEKEGGGGISNGYIYNMLKKRLKVRIFEDVFSADTIPASLLRQQSGGAGKVCIVNLAKADDAGTHFIALHILPEKIVIYDSLHLNLNLFSPALWKHLKRSKKSLVSGMKYPLQTVQSQFCGFYCIYFTLYLAKRQFANRQGLLNFYKQECEENDSIVIKNIRTMIKRNV